MQRGRPVGRARRFRDTGVSLEGYAQTPTTDLREIAERLGVGCVVAKDEYSMLGLPVIKRLGASWAIDVALAGCEVIAVDAEAREHLQLDRNRTLALHITEGTDSKLPRAPGQPVHLAVSLGV